MEEESKTKSHRSVLRRQGIFSKQITRSFPLNPIMDVAVFNKLQELVFAPYLESLDLFIVEIAPYYNISFSYKSAEDRDHPELIIDAAEFDWFSELFQQLIVLGASLNEAEIRTAKDNFFRLIDEHKTGMSHYDAAEAKSIIYKHFQQSMYLNGFIDEINDHIKIPNYRYRIKNGTVLGYSPSLPLQSLTSIICDKFNIASEIDVKLMENFCIFFWNLRIVESDEKQQSIFQDYIRKAEKKLKNPKPFLFEEVAEYINFILDDDPESDEEN